MTHLEMYLSKEVLVLDNIRIYYNNDTQYIDLPRTKDITIGAEEVSDEVTMASGKLVKDIRGFRTTIEANFDYFPADLLVTLLQVLRQGSYYLVQFPAPEGDDSGHFSISYPSNKIFKFVNGDPMWYGVSLTFTAQEVS